MKKILFLFLLLISAVFIFAANKNIPERPINIPEGVEWYSTDWMYHDRSHTFPSVRWYPNGKLSRLFYETEDKKYTIDERYFENGLLKQKNQEIRRSFIKENQEKIKYSSDNRYVGKQLLYYENGKLKEERCYTFVLKKSNILENVMCGPEVFYDETGKEVKRVEHNVKCEYGCEEAPRQSAEQLIAKIKLYKDKSRTMSLTRLPVVGTILSISPSSKKIEIAFNTGFALSTGDQVCCLLDNEIVSFECINNENGTGIFEIKEDKGNKFSFITIDTKPRFYKKNEIKAEDFLKRGNTPKAGDVKVIGGIEFVYIPAGEYFQYSSTQPGKGFTAQIKAFWMTKYEITLGEYLKYCYENNTELPGNKTDVTLNSIYPVNIGKNLAGAGKYCSWFGYKHGVKTVLPKPNEWEYAARAGTTTEFYWGNSKINDYCWYKKNSGGKLHPVGQKKPNALGLYDMIGNAMEWCDIDTIRGGSYRSDERDLQYKVSHLINYSQMDDMKDTDYKKFTGEGTSFRMIIRVPE